MISMRKVGHFAGQIAQARARKMRDGGVLHRNGGPDVNPAVKDFRPADEVARQPVGQGDLLSRRRGVVAADEAAFDDHDSIVHVALKEQCLAALIGLLPAVALDALARRRRQAADQTLLAGDRVVGLGEQNAGSLISDV